MARKQIPHAAISKAMLETIGELAQTSNMTVTDAEDIARGFRYATQYRPIPKRVKKHFNYIGYSLIPKTDRKVLIEKLTDIWEKARG